MERAAGGKSDDVGDADAFQGVDIGAIVDRRGRKAVAAAVAGEEHRLGRPHTAEAQRSEGSPQGVAMRSSLRSVRPGRW